MPQDTQHSFLHHRLLPVLMTASPVRTPRRTHAGADARCLDADQHLWPPRARSVCIPSLPSARAVAARIHWLVLLPDALLRCSCAHAGVIDCPQIASGSFAQCPAQLVITNHLSMSALFPVDPLADLG